MCGGDLVVQVGAVAEVDTESGEEAMSIIFPSTGFSMLGMVGGWQHESNSVDSQPSQTERPIENAQKMSRVVSFKPQVGLRTNKRGITAHAGISCGWADPSLGGCVYGAERNWRLQPLDKLV